MRPVGFGAGHRADHRRTAVLRSAGVGLLAQGLLLAVGQTFMTLGRLSPAVGRLTSATVGPTRAALGRIPRAARLSIPICEFPDAYSSSQRRYAQLTPFRQLDAHPRTRVPDSPRILSGVPFRFRRVRKSEGRHPVKQKSTRPRAGTSLPATEFAPVPPSPRPRSSNPDTHRALVEAAPAPPGVAWLRCRTGRSKSTPCSPLPP